MTTQKILIKELGADVTETGIRSRLERFGPIVRVDIIRDGSAAPPSALVEMDISDKAAAYLVVRLSSFWCDGSPVSACLLSH